MKQELACMTELYDLGVLPSKLPARVVCHICSRRFKPSIFKSGMGSYHYAIPPHKKKKWWKIGKARKMRE